MATTSPALNRPIFSPRLPANPARYPIGSTTFRRQKNPIAIQSASKRDGYGYGYGYGGGLVDENMAVLQKRIEELRLADRSDPDPMGEWTEWERSYYESCYGSDVCQAVGLIQLFAMSTRPGVALGLVGLVLLSVPVSVIFMGVHLWLAW